MKKKTFGVFFGIIFFLSIIGLSSAGAMVLPRAVPEKATDGMLPREVTSTVAPEKTADSRSDSEIQVKEASASTGDIVDEKKIKVWIDQPYDVFLDQAVSLIVVVENHEASMVTVNVTLVIDGKVLFERSNVEISSGDTFKAEVPMLTGEEGDHDVKAVVENYGNYYDAACWYYVHFRGQVLVWLVKPDTIKIKEKFIVHIRVWNLYKEEIILKNISLIFNGVLLYENTTETTLTGQGGDEFNVDSFFDVFTELSVDGGGEVELVVEHTQGVEHVFDRFDVQADDYKIWIEQQPEYEINEWFKIWVGIVDYTGISRNVYLKVEITYEDGTVDLVHDGDVWVANDTSVVLPFSLIYSKPGCYEVYAYITYLDVTGAEKGPIEAWCKFCIVDTIPDFGIRIKQEYVYPVDGIFFIYLVVSSNTAEAQTVTVHAEINGVTVYHGEVKVEAYGEVVIDVKLQYRVTGHYDVKAWVGDGRGIIYGDAWCEFWVFDGYFLYIEQKYRYKAGEDFGIWLHVASYTDADRYVNVTVKITFEDGTVYPVFSLNDWLMPNETYKVFWIDLSSYGFGAGFYSVEAKLITDSGVVVYAYCKFEVIAGEEWLEIWIEQKDYYLAGVSFTIVIHVKASYETTVRIKVDIGTIYHFEYLKNTTAGGEVTVNVPLTLTNGSWLVHAYVEDVFTGMWAEDKCSFRIVEKEPTIPDDFEIGILQQRVYMMNTSFRLIVWIRSKIDVNKTGHLKVEVDTLGLIWEGDVFVENRSMVMIPLYIGPDNFTVAGHYGIHARFEVGTEAYEADCDFEIVPEADIAVYIVQKPEYKVYEEFDIIVAVFCNPKLLYFTINGTLRTEITGGGGGIYTENLVIVPGYYAEFSYTAKYDTTGTYKVYAKLELDDGSVFSDECEFKIVERPVTGETTTTTTSTRTTEPGPPIFSPGFELVTLIAALMSTLTVPVILNRRKKS
ncbi:MAG: hypothetical protein ACFFD4_23705 [Candidatus Odinarchaeota archaeon]